MTRDQFVQQLAMMLRDLPRGTAANLNECMVAYWSGSEVVFAFLCERGTDAIEEEFDIDDYVWEDWQPTFEKWISSPSFSNRPEVLAWLSDAPPHEAGE
ncbi:MULTISPECIES: hypothetical protein [Paraburkholderia]|jgi:hypothetical protein|uniref:Uncharacterized protein n=1 Tax=Paraburkholderia aromaticivorans TaxID=2026199 RepID=A0A248W0X5_9BURK|nr:hypothetical protein [Paraburkholderia aromaticivorans]ASW04230.1 hypothetical protein CJU94_39485 [Paraburkholderia aromaticivorans]